MSVVLKSCTIVRCVLIDRCAPFTRPVLRLLAQYVYRQSHRSASFIGPKTLISVDTGLEIRFLSLTLRHSSGPNSQKDATKIWGGWT
jgi:hypothetical protein